MVTAFPRCINLFSELTTANLPRGENPACRFSYLAIVLDNEVVSAPSLSTVIGAHGQIRMDSARLAKAENKPAEAKQQWAEALRLAPNDESYKLEFALPKYNMYRQLLAKVLADDFVRTGVYTEAQAVDLARLLLRDNVRRVFNV